MSTSAGPYNESITTRPAHGLPMADVIVVAKRIGGSLAVIIPAEVARQEGIEEGQRVLVSVRKVTPRSAAFGKFKGQMPKYRDRSEEGGYD